MQDEVQWSDIQGLVLSGYPALTRSAFILWRIKRGHENAARRWLDAMAHRVMRAADAADGGHHSGRRNGAAAAAPSTSIRAMKHAIERKHPIEELHALNVALTAPGLQALEVPKTEYDKFSVPFREGMAPRGTDGKPTRRAYILGDHNDNDSQKWYWGAPDGDVIHGVLLIYAACDTTLHELVKSETDAMSAAFDLIVPKDPEPGISTAMKGYIDKEPREHFGFRDGISQPIIKGSELARTTPEKEHRISAVETGEIVLGYANERNATIEAPLMKNGTYLVMRQLEQHVEDFDQYLAKAAARLGRGNDEAARDWVAARLIGRLRSGEPLVSPPADALTDDPERNDFLYNFEDPDGLACPIGAHIRRANPRDSLGPDPDTALRLSKMHRILRRSRLYKRPECPGAQKHAPETGDKAGHGKKPTRGLFFVCLNADIAGQFELIQHNWLNNVHFNGLFDEKDAISHDRDHGCGAMTLQSRPVNQRINGMPRFVTVRGGSYFFMPGIRALTQLARPSDGHVTPVVQPE